MKFIILISVLLSLCCGREIEVLNVAPRISSIGPIIVEGEIAHIYFSIQDLEENPADVEIKYIMEGKEMPVKLAPYDYGVIGLTTSQKKEGNPHKNLWDIKGIDKNKMIKVKITPFDILSGRGDSMETPQWKLGDGFLMKVFLQ